MTDIAETETTDTAPPGADPPAADSDAADSSLGDSSTGDSSGTHRLVVVETPAEAPRHGHVLLHPDDLVELQSAEDSALEVAGRHMTVCWAQLGTRLQPGTVALDAATRQNAGAGPGDTVTLRPVLLRDATRVILEAEGEETWGGTPSPGRELAETIGEKRLQQLLAGLPVVTGDRVRLRLEASGEDTDFPGTLSGEMLELTVVATSPSRPVRIHSGTEVLLGAHRLAPGEPAPRRTRYLDIGGLRPQLARIRELIELPLRHPEVYRQLGIEPPSGVLLYGPPGCGKTLIARAIAQETESRFVSISGPEIVHSLYGESEAQLRKIFEEAASHAPAILFLDEIDAIAPVRERVHGEVEKRVVSQLLTLLDGLSMRRQQVVVIAATNRPNAIDPALRRPGRFDREIYIPIPDASGRREILSVHSRNMPLADDVDLQQLAAVTHGFVGADLLALCREAAMARLRRLFGDDPAGQTSLPPKRLATLRIEMGDFVTALREVEPSALREVVVEAPSLGWDQVAGLQAVKQHLTEAFRWPLLHPELFLAAGVRPTKGLLLCGPPGCGKTLIAKALASEAAVNFIAAHSAALLSRYVGDSERAVREIFQKARQAAPCILFLDELDALVPARGAETFTSGVSERVLAQFLVELDGVEELRGVLVLGATNRPDMLDPALRRPGRFDLEIEVPLPNHDERREIFGVHLANKPLADDVQDFDHLAADSNGLSGADIAEVCRRAGLSAVRRVLGGDTVERNASASGKIRVTRDDLRHALAGLRKTPTVELPPPPVAKRKSRP